MSKIYHHDRNLVYTHGVADTTIQHNQTHNTKLQMVQ